MRDSSTSLLEMKASRERSMTGDTLSSIGSFATYVSHEADGQLSKGTMDDEDQVMPVTPVISDMDQEEEEIPLEQQAQEARYQASDALDALHKVMEGIRIVTRQMKRAHDDVQASEEGSSEVPQKAVLGRARSWSDSCCTIQSCASEDDLRLSVLSQQLEGTLGADLMGLAHAAQMVGENSRMASQEASQSVRDVHMAHESIEAANERTSRAENAVRIMYKKQKELIGQLEQTKNERNVLKRQVKALLKEKAVMKEQDSVVRALELHVVGALQAHEQQLALQQAKRREENKNDDSSNVATVRLECPSHDEEEEEKADAKATEPQARKEESSSSAQGSSESNKDKDDAFVKLTTETTAKPPPAKTAPKQKAPSGLFFDSAQEESTSSVSTSGSTFFSLAQELTQEFENSYKPPSKQRPSSSSRRGGLGFGAALGLRGSFRKPKQPAEEPDSKLPTSEKNTEPKEPEKTAEIKDEQQQEPVLISPTNSVEDSAAAEGSSESCVSTAAEKEDEPAVKSEALPSTEASITTDGISPCNQASLISPSPTENAASVKGKKGFFRRSNKEQGRPKKEAVGPNKEQRRIKKAAVGTKKPLLQLDDVSVDATEGSQDYTSTSETVPASEASTASLLSCEVNRDQVPPPKSLSCDTTGQVSPFPHEFASGTPVTVLDDKAFRSLALPSFVGPSRRGETVQTMSLNSPSLPPELAEIAEIYADIGQLHEC